MTIEETFQKNGVKKTHLNITLLDCFARINIIQKRE